MNNLIQWPTAKWWEKQWNPIIGCKPCSPACEHCYAAAWAKRFGQSFEPHLSRGPRRPPRKGIVFCGNMTDLFGAWLRINQSMAFFGGLFHYSKDRLKSGTPIPNNGATYLFLTKRVGRMVDALRNYMPIHNAYFGFTAENQEWYDRRFTKFKRLPTNYKGWLSAEPLLGPIDLGLDKVYPPEAAPFQWIVVGCESGPNRRPCKIEWVESIVEQCRAANVPVFMKQICLPNGKFTNKIEEFPKHIQIRQVPWAKEKQNAND